MTSAIMRKMTISRDKRPSLKVAVIGAKSVGKSALTVRMKTMKFIHNYAPNVESKVNFTTSCAGEQVNMEILDTAALQTAENAKLEEKIKWADAFILLYSVTDENSLPALVASKCLINLYAKRRRRSLQTGTRDDLVVALVGNKNDLEHERTISEESGRAFAEAHECTHFFEISTRESYDSVKTLFDNLYGAYKNRSPKMIRSSKTSLTKEPNLPVHDEDELITAIRQRGRSRTTTLLEFNPAERDSLSPVTYRKIVDTSPLSSSTEDEHRFLGEEIHYETSPLPTRRITVHHSPRVARKSTGSPPPVPRHNSAGGVDTNNNAQLLT